MTITNWQYFGAVVGACNVGRLIWWIRRDLRIEDNDTLAAALTDATEVLPVFILDDRLLVSQRLRGARVAWMLDGLRALDADLRRHGSALIVRRGEPTTELLALCRAEGVEGVYFQRDYGPFAMERDRQVASILDLAGVRVRTFGDLVIHEAGEVLTGPGKPYGIYSPFRRKWLARAKPPVGPRDLPLDRLGGLRQSRSLAIPTATDLGVTAAPNPIVPAGEANARLRLDAFMAGPIWNYEEQRNRPDVAGTSILSPYLRWGMVSPRECYWAAIKARDNAPDEAGRRGIDSWLGELIWREFFYQILAAYPGSAHHNFRRKYDAIAWENRPDWLEAWSEGRTGYPIVDAGMRQLNETGWMHNRVRLIVASFFCKDLLLDWRLGEAVFRRRLLDGDLASNVGNWQWSAGTGTDAAPYFRILNPTAQSERFDPKGSYIRRWVPELADVPNDLIHEPHRMTIEQQRQARCTIGQDYPHPIVDHAVQRARALAMYGAAR